MVKRFKDKVRIYETDNCIEWVNAKNEYGYGIIGGSRKTLLYRAHRVSYAIFNGQLDQDMVVMHTCDNPSCVNPRHLKLGTYAENTADSIAKERFTGSPGLPGENNHQAKLNRDQVRSIRNLQGFLSSRVVASRFNVSKSQVLRIWKRESWL